MSDYISKVHVINANDEQVFRKLSNFNSIQNFASALPADAPVKDLKSDEDWVSFKTTMVGEIVLRIVEREEFKTIKIESEKSPIPLTGWIQLVKMDDEHTKIRLTLRADIPFMLRTMIGSKIEEGIDKAAEALTKIPY